MAHQHTPPDSGTRPAFPVTEPRPTCHLCSWVWQPDGFSLKFINKGCLHRALAADPSPPSAGLKAWLETAA